MWRLLFVIGISLATSRGVTGYKRVCYFTNWSQYRSDIGHYVPSDINPDLCSHIIYAFAKLQGNQLTTLEANDEQLYRQFTGLKASHPGLKTTIAVGGWNAKGGPFSHMAATKTSRSAFIQSTIRFLRSHNFDGLDIDWEYPGSRGGGPQDKHNLAFLLKEMRTAFEQEAASSGKERLLISIAVPAGKSNIDAGYDVRAVGQSVDFINLMSYDLHGSWEQTTGENSPLFASSSESGLQAQLNTAWAAKYWASQGAPRDKIIVGMSFYGRTFALASWAHKDGVGAPISGPGAAGKYSGEAGTLAYFEICKMLEAGGVDHWNADQHVPYYVNGNLWAGYDNVRSVTEKSEWIKREGFGGAMIWSLDADDFRKTCASSHHNYPLLTAINSVLGGSGGGSHHQYTTQRPQTTTTHKATHPTTHPTTHRHMTHPTTQPSWVHHHHSTQQPWVHHTTTQRPTTTDNVAVTDVYVTDAPATPSWHRTTAPTSSSHTGSFSCASNPDGYYADPSTCSVFYRCNQGNKVRYTCSPGTAYNPRQHECDWPYNVPGCDK